MLAPDEKRYPEVIDLRKRQKVRDETVSIRYFRFSPAGMLIFGLICVLGLSCTAPGVRQTTVTTDSSDKTADATILRVDFEDFRTVDWGIGHDIHLPAFLTSDPSAFMAPRNDGGDWLPFYWESSTRGRNGRCLELRVVNPTQMIRGCGVNMNFHGENALPPDREITVTVWTNCARLLESDHTDIALGWHPNDWEGVRIGGVQDYKEYSQRVNETGWELQTLTFRSHADPEVGDSVGLAFAGLTRAQSRFEYVSRRTKGGTKEVLVAAQPVLTAFFDDLTIMVAE
jgi:hypothetical protein